MLSPPKPLQQLKTRSGGWWQELREFIARSSAVDLAVGVSIGGAFTELVRSFTQDVVTPPVRQAVRGATEMARDAAGNLLPPVALGPISSFGSFGQKTFDFTVVALTVFLVAKFINRLKRTLEAKALETPPEIDEETPLEDPAVRQIAQNERIIALLETLVAQRNQGRPDPPGG